MLSLQFFLLQPSLADFFGENRKMRILGIIPKFNCGHPNQQILT